MRQVGIAFAYRTVCGIFTPIKRGWSRICGKIHAQKPNNITIPMNGLTQTLHDMPLSSLIAVGVLVALGLLLWAAGRRVLRAGFAIIGIIVGGMAGWLVGASLNLGLGSLAAAVLGAIVLAIVLALAFRIAIAVAMAAIFAIASPMGVITFAEWQARSEGKTLAEVEPSATSNQITDWLQKHDDPAARQQIEESINSSTESVRTQLDGAKSALSESLKGKVDAELDQLRQFVSRMAEVIQQRWDSTPQTLRPTLTLAMVAGAIFGLIVGGLLPTFSGAVITALGGSLLWLCGLQILAVRFGMAEQLWLPSSGTGWLAVWLITSMVGIVIQWTFRKRPADKPS